MRNLTKAWLVNDCHALSYNTYIVNIGQSRGDQYIPLAVFREDFVGAHCGQIVRQSTQGNALKEGYVVEPVGLKAGECVSEDSKC